MRSLLLVAGVAASILAGCNRAASTKNVPIQAADLRAVVSVVPQPRSMRLIVHNDFTWPGDVRMHLLMHKEVRLGAEGYEIHVRRAGIRVIANTRAGLFYGVQTLEQLTATDVGVRRTPGVDIVDWPQYRWRGIHLDVSRHFFGVSDIERFLDVAAHYKLNIFHWHLTDDQAWRVPVAGYPRLTAGEAFYSEQDIRAVVSFAAARAITVVPEIEVPGHSQAARRAYPQTRRFFDDVLRSVMRLFPGPYIHLGGDEVVYSSERIAVLQRAAAFVQSHGRRAVVWDDALATHLTARTVIMSWRGEKTALQAMRMGYDVVLSPDGPLYFDAAQGAFFEEPAATAHMATLEQVYDYSPRPVALGVQANVWTEKIATISHLEYMTMPRELALAEIAWDAPSAKDWGSFVRRLPAQLTWLDRRGYGYRVPNTLFSVRAAHVKFTAVRGNPQSVLALTDSASVEINLNDAAPGSVIHYTIDEGGRQASRTFRHVIRLHVENRARIEVRAVAILPDGRRSSTTSCIIEHVSTPALAQVHPYSRSWSALVSP